MRCCFCSNARSTASAMSICPGRCSHSGWALAMRPLGPKIDFIIQGRLSTDYADCTDYTKRHWRRKRAQEAQERLLAAFTRLARRVSRPALLALGAHRTRKHATDLND